MAKEHPLKKAKEETRPTEAEKIEDWRRKEFTRILGPSVNYDQITELVNSDADLQEARDLADNGCPPDLIVQILSPL